MYEYEKLIREKGEENFVQHDPKYYLYLSNKTTSYSKPLKFTYKLLEKITHLKQGDCFGEYSLLFDKPRSATCEADEGEVHLIVLTKDDY